MSREDDEYVVPLQDQRVFGAGIKRQRIAFVPASQGLSALSTSNSGQPQQNVGERYLSIVLPKSASQTPEPAEDGVAAAKAETGNEPEICDVCKQVIDRSSDEVATDVHETSIAHQVCLEHSHPPSHLDRDHVGVRYLTGYGWNPDSRKGLGANQEGIRIPIKAKEKKDTVGLRETVDEDDISLKKRKPAKREEKPLRLDAGAVRKQDIEAKKRAERLRSSFYGPDLSAYLTEDAPAQPVRPKRSGIKVPPDVNPG